MSTRLNRFEVVHTEAGVHARFRTSNGTVVWLTPDYKRRRTAIAAIEVITDNKVRTHNGDLEVEHNGVLVEVREIDERGEQS